VKTFIISKPLLISKPVLLLILALATIFAPKVHSQNNAIWVGAGIQISKMDDMKYLQELILETYPVEGKISSSFPTYVMGSFGFLHQLYPAVRIGAGYGYSSTGAKSNYTDYSGYVTTLMNAVSHRVGGHGSYSVLTGEWYELSLYGRLDVKYTLMDITSSLYALGASSLTESKYSSVSMGGSAGVEFLIHLKKYSFGVEGGYEIDARGKLSNKENKNELFDPNERDRVLTSDWTGWYAQLKFLLWLGL
jgi:hypothetical protein